jgi:hypothetical protein
MVTKEQIFPSIITAGDSDWRVRIKEAGELGLKEAALFINGISLKERAELCDLLDGSGIKSIPILHLRNDVTEMEVEYFYNEYGTKIFMIHPGAEYPFFSALLKFEKNIFIENTSAMFNEAELKRYGGICLNISHLENERLQKSVKLAIFQEFIERFPPSCNCISAIKKDPEKTFKGYLRYDNYFLGDFSELDYLKSYPAGYFSDFIALELKNDLKTQLAARDYIVGILKQ